MQLHLNALLLVCLIAIQVLGLFSAMLARLSIGSRYQKRCQWLFVACLAMVGGTTVVLLGVAPGWWIVSAASLSVMVLTATCESNRSERATAW